MNFYEFIIPQNYDGSISDFFRPCIAWQKKVSRYFLNHSILLLYDSYLSAIS